MVIAPALVPEVRGVVAVLSTVTRQGDWILPRLFRAASFMGSVEIDLTTARIGPGTSEVQLRAVMSNVKVLVPPDLRVECEVDPVLGATKVIREAESTTSAQAPLVRITGTAFLASVEVMVVDPNARGWIEKLRARWSFRGR